MKHVARVEELVDEVLPVLRVVRVPSPAQDDHLALVGWVAHELQLKQPPPHLCVGVRAEMRGLRR